MSRAVSLSAHPLSENAADKWPPRGGIRFGGATADLGSLSGKVRFLAPGRDHLRGVLGGDAIDLGAEAAGLRGQHAEVTKYRRASAEPGLLPPVLGDRIFPRQISPAENLPRFLDRAGERVTHRDGNDRIEE